MAISMQDLVLINTSSFIAIIDSKLLITMLTRSKEPLQDHSHSKLLTPQGARQACSKIN